MNKDGAAQTIILDLAGVSTSEELHRLFMRELKFPSYYGHNWNAFWDVLSGEGCFPERLILKGSESLKNRLPRDFEIMRQCFERAQGGCPWVSLVVEWQ